MTAGCIRTKSVKVSSTTHVSSKSESRDAASVTAGRACMTSPSDDVLINRTFTVGLELDLAANDSDNFCDPGDIDA